MSIKIVTVSSSDITQEMANEFGITVIPHQIAIGDKSFADGVDISPEEFYKLLESSPVIPKTSAVTIGAFAEAYNKLADESDEILCVVLSSGLSVTYEAAIQAKKLIKKKPCRIEVVETLGVAGGLGLIVLDAIKEIKAGEKLSNIVEMIKRNSPRCHIHICLDTLKYLQKGGRIGKAQALLGSLLGVKPIIEARGEFLPIGRVRSHAKSIEHIYNYVKSFKNIHSLSLEYTSNKDEVDSLADRIAKFIPRHKIHIWPLTPVCGVHTGPRSIVASVVGDI